MRLFEGTGMGAVVLTDAIDQENVYPRLPGLTVGHTPWKVGSDTIDHWKERVRAAIDGAYDSDVDGPSRREEDFLNVMQQHTYVQRVPALLGLARSL
jgi:hypothetical protein